jgi:hypothetical protein
MSSSKTPEQWESLITSLPLTSPNFRRSVQTYLRQALSQARLEGAKAGIQAAVGWHEQKADECAAHGFKKQAESHRLDAYEISALDPQQVINESMGK